MCVLFSVMASPTAFAANVIDWTVSPASGLPANTQPNYSYRVTYTIFNNHSAIPIPITTNQKATGPFTIIDNCNGVALAPKGQANSSCTIAVTYAPTQPTSASLQAKVNYGFNQVRLPVLTTQTSTASTTASQGRIVGYMPGYSQPSSAQALFTAGYTDIL